MSFVLQRSKKRNSAVAVQYLKGEVSGADFTARVFSIELKDEKWRVSGSKIDTQGTTYKIQLDIPASYSKGVYKLQDHPDIVITYSTTDLDNPILKYVGEGLFDLVEIDPANDHMQGGLAGGLTKEDGDGVVLILAFLFSFG